MPLFQQPAPTTASAPARRPGALTATVLTGALLIGGAAGVGGAAWYDAWQGDDGSSKTNTSSSSDDNSQLKVTGSPKAKGSVEAVAKAVLPSVVKINVSGSSESGSGSGIIISPDGEILTNNHVVQVAGKGGSITVNFNDGKTKRASVVGTDKMTDVAVIKASGVSGLSAAKIGQSSALQVGQEVVAVGSPYGLNATVTSGIVSALNRPVSVSTQPESGSSPFGQFGQGQQQQQNQQNNTTSYPAIQTDAAINPGNSGGPLVNMAGQVVGIDAAIRTSEGTVDQGGSIGLGFAIPIDEVRPIVDQLLDHQTPTHARLGVTVSDISGNALQQGAQIKEVESGGAGDKAGLKSGDVITAVNDQAIDGSESLVATVRGHRPGDKVTLTVVRGGHSRKIDATLGTDAGSKDS